MKPTQFRKFRFWRRRVTPYARSRNFQLAHDGSSLGTNAVLRRPPSVAQRHQIDYTFHCLELPAVNFTAASCHGHKPAAVDATSASFNPCKLRAVRRPLSLIAFYRPQSIPDLTHPAVGMTRCLTRGRLIGRSDGPHSNSSRISRIGRLNAPSTGVQSPRLI